MAESRRLLRRGDPEDNLATSTIDGLRAETLKRYFKGTGEKKGCCVQSVVNLLAEDS